MSTFTIPLRPANAGSADLTLGRQISMSLDVTRASTTPAIARYLPVAGQFAERYNFYLPAPTDFKARNLIEEFQKTTVPYFTLRMQPVFDKRIKAMTRAGNVCDDFTIHELAGVNLAEAAKAGLLTFDSTAALLDAVKGDAEGLLNAIPPYRPAANPYYRAVPVVGRVASIGALYILGLLFTDSILVTSGFTAGAAVAMEAAATLRGRKVMQSQLVNNRQTAVQVDRIYNTLQRVATQRFELDQAKDIIPSKLSHPGPVSEQMRLAMLKERLGGNRCHVYIINDAAALGPCIGTKVKYLAVELPGGRREFRSASPNFLHPNLKLDGEEVLGAGYMRFEENGTGKGLLKIDGRSRSYPTQPKQLEEVSAMLRKIIGNDINLAVVDYV